MRFVSNAFEDIKKLKRAVRTLENKNKLKRSTSCGPSRSCSSKQISSAYMVWYGMVW